MGIVHTPRVIASITRGLLKRRNAVLDQPTPGLGLENPYVYLGRAGLFDIDYLGHLNNAAYLNHAEMARWEMTAYNGMLSSMHNHKISFLVAGCAVRYRRELGAFRKFQVDSSMAALDENKNMWIIHNFRYPDKERNRVRAQIVVRGVCVKGRSVIEPRDFFVDMAKFDKDTVEAMVMPHKSVGRVEDLLLERYSDLEDSFRELAAQDDKNHDGM